MASRKAKAKPPGGAVTILPPTPNTDHQFKPGNEGKKPGTVGKDHRALRSMILDALEMSGGVHYLVYHAMVNPQLFMPLIGKVIPLQIAGDPNEPLNVVHHYIARKSVAPPKKK